MTTTRYATIAAILSMGIVAPVLAAEDVVEHETYEKRSMKIETVPMTPPAPPAPTRVYEHHDESESTVERHATTPPAAVVKERTTDSVEVKEKN